MSKWVTVKSRDDFPKVDCFVVFLYREDWPVMSEVVSPANLNGSVGFLSWSSDFPYGRIIEDGEIVQLGDVAAFCKIPSPIGVKINVS